MHNNKVKTMSTNTFPMEYHGYTIRKCELGRYYITDKEGAVVRSWVGYGSLLLAKTNVLMDIEQRAN